MSSIEVEFFGIARQRVQHAAATISVDGPLRLFEVLRRLATRFPDLSPDCIIDGKLSRICAANINGDQFLSDGDTILRPGDRLLIMSADAGG